MLKNREISPETSIVKAVTLGSIIAIIGSSFATILLIGGGVLAGIIDIEDLNSSIASSHLFMTLDIFLSSIIYFFSGCFAAKYSPDKELKSGCFVAAISLVFFILFGGGFDILPLFYNLSALLSVGGAPVIGAYYIAKNVNSKKGLE